MQWPSATQYVEAIQHPRTCFKDRDLQESTPALDRLGMPFVSSGQFAYVFKLNHTSGKSSAVRCFRGFIGDRETRYKAIDQHLDSVKVPSLASFEYETQGILIGSNRYPILLMEWIAGPTLDVYLEAALQKHAGAAIRHLADQWIKIIQSLRSAQIAHGDLQHGNIIVQNGTLRLVDLDGMFVPSIARLNSSELGHRHYQHPLRDQFFFNSDLDSFSALVIYVSLISLAERPDLWTKFHDENLILTRSDFLNSSGSPAFSEINKLGGEPRRLVEILEKACKSAPSATPALPDLVAPKSKLPAWMTEPAGVVMPTKTREVIPGQPLSGASSNTAPPQTAVQPPPPTWMSQGSLPGPAQRRTTDWRQVPVNTISAAMPFGFMGLLFVWAWFPLLNGIYSDLGAQSASTSLAIWTYVLGVLAFGFISAIRKAKSAPRVTVPSLASAPPLSSAPASTVYSTSPSTYRSRARPSPSSFPFSASQHPSTVVGSRIRFIYHRPSCEYAQKISTRNRVSFASIANAQAAGYRRCFVCLP